MQKGRGLRACTTRSLPGSSPARAHPPSPPQRPAEISTPSIGQWSLVSFRSTVNGWEAKVMVKIFQSVTKVQWGYRIKRTFSTDIVREILKGDGFPVTD